MLKNSSDHGVMRTERQSLEVEPKNLIKGLDNVRVFNETMGRQKHIIMRNLRNMDQAPYRYLQVFKNKPTPRQKLIKRLVRDSKAQYEEKMAREQQKNLNKDSETELLSGDFDYPYSPGLRLDEPMSAQIQIH